MFFSQDKTGTGDGDTPLLVIQPPIHKVHPTQQTFQEYLAEVNKMIWGFSSTHSHLVFNGSEMYSCCLSLVQGTQRHIQVHLKHLLKHGH